MSHLAQYTVLHVLSYQTAAASVLFCAVVCCRTGNVKSGQIRSLRNAAAALTLAGSTEGKDVGITLRYNRQRPPTPVSPVADVQPLAHFTQLCQRAHQAPVRQAAANLATPPPTVKSAAALVAASWEGFQEHFVCITHFITLHSEAWKHQLSTTMNLKTFMICVFILQKCDAGASRGLIPVWILLLLCAAFQFRFTRTEIRKLQTLMRLVYLVDQREDLRIKHACSHAVAVRSHTQFCFVLAHV